MFKKILIILSLIIVTPALAGEFENALNQGVPAFLYLHTSYCKYCKQVTPLFDKLAQANKSSCKFISVDADSAYGRKLMRDFRANYIPYALLIDSRKEIMVHVDPDCMINYACMEKELKQFLK